MCLAIPAIILNKEGFIATVEVEGVKRKCNLSLVPEARPGDYVIMHAGFAIQILSKEDVDEYKKIIEEMGLFGIKR